MSSLKMLERDCIEELFDMAGGYVLDFTNRTFSEFFRESAAVDIYSDEYAINGDSKARRLRAFLELEDDAVVGKTLVDLLEYWRYRNPHPSTDEAALADRATHVAQRLLGRNMERRDEGEEFLKQDFGGTSLRRIATAGALAPIIEARYAEAVRCLTADAPLAVIFHCGGILEGLLLSIATANAREFNQAVTSPKDKVGKPKRFSEWTLAELIDVACELGHLPLDVKKFSHCLRDFRNYIHPHEQMRSGFSPDRHTAEICLQVLKAAAASLSGERPVY